MKSDDLLQEYLDQLAAGRSDQPCTGCADNDVLLAQTALKLVELRPDYGPRSGFVRASRRRIQARLSSNYVRNPWRMWSLSAVRWWQSPTLHLVLVVLMTVMLYYNASGFVQASRFWLPGDFMYPIKPVAENMRLLATFSPEKDAALHIEYAHRRMIEVQGLVFENRFDEIPGAVANFDYHVTRAVTLVNLMANSETGNAQGLAASLESTLSSQMGLVTFFANVLPEPVQADFDRMLMISTGGVQGIQNILELDSSNLQPWGYQRICWN